MILPPFGLFIYFHLACRQYFASGRQYYLFRLALRYIRYARVQSHQISSLRGITMTYYRHSCLSSLSFILDSIRVCKLSDLAGSWREFRTTAHRLTYVGYMHWLIQLFSEYTFYFQFRRSLLGNDSADSLSKKFFFFLGKLFIEQRFFFQKSFFFIVNVQYIVFQKRDKFHYSAFEL